MAIKTRKKHLVLTSFFIKPEYWIPFRQIAEDQGTTASALLRGYMIREVRRSQKESAAAAVSKI
jgi:hypothetical protein